MNSTLYTLGLFILALFTRVEAKGVESFSAGRKHGLPKERTHKSLRRTPVGSAKR